MHGLINRSIQSFLRDTYGEDVWQRVVRLAGLDFESFQAMLFYDDKLTHATLAAASGLLQRPAEALLEDVGTYLVSHPNLESLRRLMRFGGVTFEDFLHSLGLVAHIVDEDSLGESSALDRRHAEALSHPLSHDELVRLQCRATPARLALGLV